MFIDTSCGKYVQHKVTEFGFISPKYQTPGVTVAAYYSIVCVCVCACVCGVCVCVCVCVCGRARARQYFQLVKS
jgi:hypothetical protein